MDFNGLPNEILIKIFEYSGNWLDLVLVSKNWRNLIEDFHTFDKSKYFTAERSEEDKEIAIFSYRKYKTISLVLTDQINLDDVSSYMESDSSIENVEIKLSQSSKESFLMKLLQSFKNVKSMSIIVTWDLEDEDQQLLFPNILYKNLTNLEIYYRSSHLRTVDKCLSFIETPEIQHFALKSRNSEFENLEFALQFINKYSQLKLKHFDLICYILSSRHWLEFLWTGETLRFTECQHELIRTNFCEFVKNNHPKFQLLKQIFMYRSQLPDITRNLLFMNASNLETLSTDGFVPSTTKSKLYRQFKILKLWSLSNLEMIYHISQSFPYIEKLFVYAAVDPNMQELLKSLLKNLKEFKSGMGIKEFNEEYPKDFRDIKMLAIIHPHMPTVLSWMRRRRNRAVLSLLRRNNF